MDMVLQVSERQKLHRAIEQTLDDGEIAIHWCLVIDVAGPDQTRYLAHRSGGGHNGDESPMLWTALGMLKASIGLAEQQLAACTTDATDIEDDGDE